MVSSEIKAKIEEFLSKGENLTLRFQNQNVGTNIKLEDFINNERKKLVIFRIETKEIRVDVLDRLKKYLSRNRIKYSELQNDSVNELEIGVEGNRKIRIEIKPDTSERQRLRNLWYNSTITSLYSRNEIQKMTPNDTNELKVLKKINEAIDGDPITLKIGNKTYKDVIAVLGVPGTPKADFVVVDKNKTELCWISYKAGSTAKSFQQYSGISEKFNKDLFNDPEVEYFRKQVVSLSSNEGIGNGIHMKIDNRDLKKKSIYGKDYREGEKIFGKDNVTFFVQGEPRIVNNNGVVRLTFGTKMCENGTLRRLTRHYEPVLGARKGSGRKIISGKDVAEGTRGGIFTKQYMKARKSKKIPNQKGK